MDTRLDAIQPGDKIGPYRVVRGFQGRGGMGAIFEVEVREKYQQPEIPNRLALKVAKDEYQASLVTESDFLSRFEHPNVVRIYPIAGRHKPVYAARTQLSSGWVWYYTMELVRGGSLEHRLTRPSTVTDLLRPSPSGIRRLGVLEAIGVGIQLAGALEHIHTQNVVNLDVKPGNVLFRKRRFEFVRGSVPEAVICDFGIARDVRYPRTGLLGVATPEYVSPEQASEPTGSYSAPERSSRSSHQMVDTRSDIFSLGVLLYEGLTGTLPFENLARVVDPNYVPTPPRQLRSSIPQRLDEIVMRALAKNRNYRFRTAEELRAALQEVRRPIDWRAGVRRTFAGVTLVGCIALGGWGVSQVMDGDSTPTPKPEAPSAATTAAPFETSTPLVATSTPAPTLTPTATVFPTATRLPTLTPTNTYPPPTLTLTPSASSMLQSTELPSDEL